MRNGTVVNSISSLDRRYSLISSQYMSCDAPPYTGLRGRLKALKSMKRTFSQCNATSLRLEKEAKAHLSFTTNGLCHVRTSVPGIHKNPVEENRGNVMVRLSVGVEWEQIKLILISRVQTFKSQFSRYSFNAQWNYKYFLFVLLLTHDQFVWVIEVMFFSQHSLPFIV